MSDGLKKIYIIGEHILRKRVSPVGTVGYNERMIFEQMFQLMQEHGGLGLAANQVGVDKQMCVVSVGERVFKLADPKILRKSGCDIIEEGCLSLPTVGVKVKRAKIILCQATDENNKLMKFEAKDLLARVIQHEIDHLYGKMIIDYAPFWQRRRLLKEVRESCNESG